MKLSEQGFDLGNAGKQFGQQVFAKSVQNGGLDVGIIAEAGKSVLKSTAMNYANNAIGKGINKIFDKYDSKIKKALGFLGLDKGGDSNVYDKIAAMPDPLFDWEFRVIMPTISTMNASAPALLSEYILDIDIPLESFQSEEMKVNGSPVKVMGFSELGDCTVSIYADHATVAHEYVNAWYASVKSRNGRYTLPYAANNMGYKKMIQVILYKGAIPILLFSISGCMPTTRGNYSLKSTPSGSILTYDQTFSVDRVYITSLYDPGNTFNGSVGDSLANTAISAISKGLSQKIRGF